MFTPSALAEQDESRCHRKELLYLFLSKKFRFGENKYKKMISIDMFPTDIILSHHWFNTTPLIPISYTDGGWVLFLPSDLSMALLQPRTLKDCLRTVPRVRFTISPKGEPY
jgi:hypothetical protein